MEKELKTLIRLSAEEARSLISDYCIDEPPSGAVERFTNVWLECSRVLADCSVVNSVELTTRRTPTFRYWCRQITIDRVIYGKRVDA